MITVVLLGGLIVAACGGGPSDDAAEAPLESDPSISDGLPLADDNATAILGMGPGISVADALASTVDEPLLVNGYVFVFADGSVMLADLIDESFPPQPAGASVTVEGLDVMQIPLTEGPADAEIEITAWTDTSVQLLGDLVDGTFVVDALTSG
jgi:hypothetical protein